MKTHIIFYSYTGHVAQLAQELAAKESLGLEEIKDVKRPGKIKAYTTGCFAAMRGKPWKIQPLKVDLSAYDRLIIFSPVWAGNPPPAINALLKQLPEGKTLSIRMVSASGKSNCRERLEAAVKAKGCTLKTFKDIKS